MKKSIFSIAIAAALFTASFANAQTAQKAAPAPVKSKTAVKAPTAKTSAATKAPAKPATAAKAAK